MHVELAPRRREAVPPPGSWPGATRSGREQGPGHVGWVERVEVVAIVCRGQVLKRRRKGHCGGLQRLVSRRLGTLCMQQQMLSYCMNASYVK
jgi:hypothetical protein